MDREACRDASKDEHVSNPKNVPPPDTRQPTPVVVRIWQALREVEDPEIPVSLVDMRLIVAVDYEPSERTARLRITYTAMGCPAMEMIQDDIRQRLLREPEIEV